MTDRSTLAAMLLTQAEDIDRLRGVLADWLADPRAEAAVGRDCTGGSDCRCLCCRSTAALLRRAG